MELRRIVILVMLELVCTSLAQPQSPPSQSSADARSQATSNVQSQGASDDQAVPQPTQEQAPAQQVEPPHGRLLSGAEIFAPEGGGRSFVVPAVQFVTYANSNPGGTSGASKINGEGAVTGALDLRRVWTGSQLNLVYAGGEFLNFGPGFLSNSGKASNYGTFHSLTLLETVDWHHWQLQLADMATYLPQSPFGFGGFAGLDTFGLTPNGSNFAGAGMGFGGGSMGYTPLLNGALAPNQTILSGYARRFSDTPVAEVEYSHGRSAITATAAYGMLHFLDPGFIDSDSLTLFTGYDYLLSRRDIIAITAVYSDFQFKGNHPSIINRGGQLRYGRKLARKLFLNLGGGPIFSETTVPLYGNVTTRIWSTFDSLEYRVARGSLGITYSRAPTSGSGVLLGAENDWVSMSAMRQLSHTAYGSLSVGYARNSSLQRSVGVNQHFQFDSWNASTTFGWPLTERVNGYFYGNVSRQISNTSVCSLYDCGRNVFTYTLGLGINWHGRPSRLR